MDNYAIGDDHEMKHMFLEYVKTYQKSYPHDEYQVRYNNFKNNVERIYMLNKQPGQQAHFAINKFTDMSPQEFGMQYLLPKFSSDDQCKFPYHRTVVSEEKKANLPTSFDWRKKHVVTPIKDQASCGSCWAFSVIGNIEGMWALGGNKLTNLSEQWVVDCSKSCLQSNPQACNAGCGGGLPWLGYGDIIANKFVTTEKAYPYVGYDQQCKPVTEVGAKISNWTAIDPDMKSIEAYLTENGPLSICLNADMLMSYSGGIITGTPDQCSSMGTDHAVTLVGYDNTGSIPFWIVKNSWGLNWGEKGYFRIQADNDLCGIWDCTTSSIL